jgi:hypothetical protein
MSEGYALPEERLNAMARTGGLPLTKRPICAGPIGCAATDKARSGCPPSRHSPGSRSLAQASSASIGCPLPSLVT